MGICECCGRTENASGRCEHCERAEYEGRAFAERTGLDLRLSVYYMVRDPGETRSDFAVRVKNSFTVVKDSSVGFCDSDFDERYS